MSHTTAGLEISGDRIAFIRDGVTTRADVVENLGMPLFDLEPEQVIAYAWETGGNVGFGFDLFGSYKEVSRMLGRFLFCVRFDEHGVVCQHGKTRLLEAETSTDAIRRWVSMK